MKPYSKDLRLWVLSAVDAATLREQLAKTFSVSMPTIKRWLKRRRETGDVKPKPIPGRPPRKGALLQSWLPKHLKANDDLTLEEHRGAFEEEFGQSRSLRPPLGGLSLLCPMADGRSKKSLVASERDEEARGLLWRWLASRFDARRLVFVDELGFHTSMTRLRTRALKGKRAYGKVPRNLKAIILP